MSSAAGARLPGTPVVPTVDDGALPGVVLVQDAEALLQQARAEAQRLREQDRVAVLAEQDRVVAEALEAAGRQCRQQIEAFAHELKNRVSLDAATRQRAVQQVVEFVRGTA